MPNMQTYGISDVPDLDRQIESLKAKENEYQSQLTSSPTALGGSGEPTQQDISTQQSLKDVQGQIRSLTDSKLRARWYKPLSQDTSVAAAGESNVSPGAIGKTLDFIAKPFYGVVGATKHVIGQGSGTLYQDIADNMMRNKNTFSDVLRTTGVPGSIAAPLGFALDVAMDPVNWTVMGTGALIPRLFSGAYKGVKGGEGLVKGLSVAGKSGLLEKAVTVGRFVPVYRKKESFVKLGNRAMESTRAWEALSGITAEQLVLQKGMGIGAYRVGLGDLMNKAADNIPGGKKLLEVFWYSPKEWIRQARFKDILARQLIPDVDVKAAFDAHNKGRDMLPYMNQIAKEQLAIVRSKGKIPSRIDLDSTTNLATRGEVDAAMAKMEATDPSMAKKVPEMAVEVVKDVDDAYSLLKYPHLGLTDDPIENAARIASEVDHSVITAGDLERIVQSGALDATDVKWFDTLMLRGRSFEKQIISNATGEYSLSIRGKAILDIYDGAMLMFRAAKVALSPTAYTNAIIGNMIMTHMANGDIGPDFLKTLKVCWDFYRSKPGAAKKIEELIFQTAKNKGTRNPEMEKVLEAFRSAQRGTFGLDLLDRKTVAERALRAGRDIGYISSKTTAAHIAPELNEALNVVEEFIKASPPRGGFSVMKQAIENKSTLRFDRGTGMLSNEMFNTKTSAEILKFAEEQAIKKPNHLGWKLANLVLNKAPSTYEKIDQVYKLTTFIRATSHGYTLNQIRQMRHIIDISPEEMTLGRTITNGRILYTLQPQTALELAGTMYLNYNAMPAAIRVIRNFPLLSSPFISFMYGMTLKTGQTLAYNPSAFNKVTFAMNDFGGTKTPLEKKALDKPYYSYLKQPGMFRMPFFNENPIYLNLASAIPYYSLNMFSPTYSRQKGNSIREKLVQGVQESPLLKDPIGGVLFDFLIQPLILGEIARPMGQFGQPLYPIDASGLEKFGYGLRTQMEAFVPNIAAYSGLVVPSKYADLMPIYRGRSLSRAKVGQNQLGISGKEHALSRTIREFFKTSGISVQAPVNTTFSQGGE